MGKGEIVSHISGGQYNVTLKYDRHRITEEIARLTTQIADLAVIIAGMEEGQDKDNLTLRKTSLEKRKALLIDTLITDPTLPVWCTDLTEDLTGIVGTVEVPGERGTVLIQPGYDGNAAYNSTRDGQLQKPAANTAAGTFWNAAMLAGWQKWRPTYRFGEITAISGDTCDVRLEQATSSAQNLNINQTATLSSVTIEYMGQGGAPFSVNDNVVVKFENQDWNSPKVIGFKDNPKSTLYTTRFMAVGAGGDIYMHENSVWSKVADGNGTPLSTKFTSSKWGLPSGLHWFTWSVSYDAGTYTWILYHLNKTTYEWDYFDEWEYDGDDDDVDSYWDLDSLLYTANGIACAAYLTNAGRYVVKLWDGGSIKEWLVPIGGGEWGLYKGELIYNAFRDSLPFGVGTRAGFNFGWFPWTGLKRKISFFDGSSVNEHDLPGYRVWSTRFGRGVVYCRSSASNESCVINEWRTHDPGPYPLFDNRYMDYPHNDNSIAYIVGGDDVPEADRYKIYQIPLSGTNFHALAFEDGTQVGAAFPDGSPRGLRVIDEGLE